MTCLDPLLICLFPAGGCPAEGRGVQDLGPGTVGKPGRCLGGRDEKCRARMGHRDPGGLWNTHSISGQAKWGKIRCPCQVESRKPGEIIFNQGARCSGDLVVFRPTKLGMRTPRSEVMLKSANHIMNGRTGQKLNPPAKS